MTRDVGVGQLVKELEQRGDRLPFEIGAFVALEACEGLLQEAVKLDADDVRVTLEGSVVVAGSAERAGADEAARSLVSVLAQLLVAAGPGVPPYLLELVNASASGQKPRDLRHLHDAIEASLIPINRGASRRVLARLVRESDRPPAAVAPRVDPQELDAELDELLRDPISRSMESSQTQLPLQEQSNEQDEPVTERIRIPRSVAADAAPVSFPPPVPDLDFQPETVPVPPSEPAMARGSSPLPNLKAPQAAASATAPASLYEQPPQPGPEPITATIRKWSPPEKAEMESVAASSAEGASEAKSVAVSGTVTVSEAPSESLLETPTESVFGTGSVSSAESIPAPEPQRITGSLPSPPPAYDRASVPEPRPRARRGSWGVWLLAAALGLGAYALISNGTLDRLLQPAAPPVAVVPSGLIDVTVSPADAQIFVFVGRGPAVALGLTVGGAHEFIVFDRGLRPSRAVVPAGAVWATNERGSLYELAVQAQPAEAPTDTLALGEPTTTPTVAETASAGTIRIITNPPGAKVYRFVGVGPAAQIAAASIHEGQEILVYHPEHEIRRAVIGPSDWQASEGGHRASLDVELPMLPGSAALETPEN